MCGITGFVGKRACQSFVLEGLSRLEYRGYDSAGFACVDRQSSELMSKKRSGSLDVLRQALAESSIDGYVGIGHTRWATHGIASTDNAHPHIDCTGKVALVHNGIIEDHAYLRKELVQAGHYFRSQTDTEIIAHLCEDLLAAQSNLIDIITNLTSMLTGAFALVLMFKDYPETLVAIRCKSPLVIGIGAQEMYVSSDAMAFADVTQQALFMPERSFALIQHDQVAFYTFEKKKIHVSPTLLTSSYCRGSKDGFAHYMLKEIYEQPRVITQTVQHFQDMTMQQVHDSLNLDVRTVRAVDSMHFVGCGTSWHAAAIGKFYFEAIAGIPTSIHLASEFRYQPLFLSPKSIVCGISQSGETADTLEALRLVGQRGIPAIAITNVGTSTMVQETQGHLVMHAGPEISVCSTKAFAAQLTSLYWLAHWYAVVRNCMPSQVLERATHELILAGELLASSIESYKEYIIKTLAPFYAIYEKCIFLGRHISYPFAAEAALKLKEISYIFAQAYPAGELKHGSIALIDAQVPVIVFSVLDELLYQKIVANTQEVKARDGHVLVFAFEGQDELVELADFACIIPRTTPLLEPLVMTGIMQFLMYQIACVRKLPVDKPRNLAKSVTVE